MNIVGFYGRLMRQSASEPTEFIGVAQMVRWIICRRIEAIVAPPASFIDEDFRRWRGHQTVAAFFGLPARVPVA